MPVRVNIRNLQVEAMALLDTGLTGDLVLPKAWLTPALGFPDGHIALELGDARVVSAPVYLGTIQLAGLFPLPVRIAVLGNEHILGRGVIDRFEVTFDHGRRVIVKP